MWRFLCLALLAEVSFGRVLEKIEKKPVVLVHEKLKTDSKGKILFKEETVRPMVEETREKVLVTPVVKSKFLEKPVAAAKLHHTWIVDDAVFPTMFDDMEKTEGRPIVEEGYYPYREDDEFDNLRTKLHKVYPRQKITTKPMVTEEKNGDKFLDDFDFEDLEERIPEKLLSYKLEEFLETINIDKRRKVCILAVHRTIYHLAEYKKTGKLPEPVLKRKRQVKKLIGKVMDLPVKFDIREEEEDIREVEMELNLPFTRLTPELRKMKRELVRECGDKYPVFA